VDSAGGNQRVNDRERDHGRETDLADNISPRPTLGTKLYIAAAGKKQFVTVQLIEAETHYIFVHILSKIES